MAIDECLHWLKHTVAERYLKGLISGEKYKF